MKEVRISLPAWECHDGTELVDLLTELLRDEPRFSHVRFTVAAGQPELRCEECGRVVPLEAGAVGVRCPQCGSPRLAVKDSEVRVSLVT